MTPPGSSGAPRQDRAWIGAGVVGALAAMAFAWGGRDFCLDDAWIHLAYAKSLRLGDGWSYNPGDWETGSSSPLWVALLALCPIERAPLLVAKGLGASFHAATAALAACLAGILARRGHGDGTAARGAMLVAGGLVALQPTLLQAAASGMEVGLASALLLAAACLAWAERPRFGWAFVVGACAVWARPEALVFVACLGAARLPAAWRARAARVPLFLVAGGVFALACWVGYCWFVSGYAWPNTRYVKASGGGLSGLGYLIVQVLPWHPWLVGVGGAVLGALGVARALRERETATLALVVAWLATWAAIGVSRRLDPQVFFYLARYFDIVAAVPAVVVGLGFARARGRLRHVALAPVAVVAALQIASLHPRVRAQEEGIRVLHSESARVLARTLPADSVVIVEGAGAARYLTPRSMTIVDMLGLNDRALAHAADDYARVCALVSRQATHLLVPDRYLGSMAAVFQLRPLGSFLDRHSAQTAAFAPRRVVLAEITGLRPGPWQDCARSGGR